MTVRIQNRGDTEKRSLEDIVSINKPAELENGSYYVILNMFYLLLTLLCQARCIKSIYQSIFDASLQDILVGGVEFLQQIYLFFYFFLDSTSPCRLSQWADWGACNKSIYLFLYTIYLSIYYTFVVSILSPVVGARYFFESLFF